MNAGLLLRAFRFVAPLTIVTSVALFGQVSSAPATLTPDMKSHAFDVASPRIGDNGFASHTEHSANEDEFLN
jgi:hypothetical protein